MSRITWAFPEGIAGQAILDRGRQQVERYGVEIIQDDMQSLVKKEEVFHVTGHTQSYCASRVLIATGLTHLLPEIAGVRECLGLSLFFCKDCDAYRVQGKRIVIIGHNNEAADCALARLPFSASVLIAFRRECITCVEHDNGHLRALTFGREDRVDVDAAFATRGDVTHTDLFELLGTELDPNGRVRVDACLRTSVPGLYAAGCVTPANWQMIIAAGQGATAAQTINRDIRRKFATPQVTSSRVRGGAI